ncbi:hypothetical protein R84B8_00430 [Treponema sp. R8-4-B8]
MNEDASRYILQGFKYQFDGDHNAAIKEFNRAIELDPKNDDAYFFRGCEYFNLDEFVKAISDYTQAITLNQKDNYYLNRGYAYIKEKKFKEAHSDLETALRLNPDNNEAKNELAQLKSIVERLKEAHSDLETALRLNPDNNEAKNDLAWLKSIEY